MGRTALASSGFGVTGNTITVSGTDNAYSLTWANKSSNWAFNSAITHDGGSGQCVGPIGTYSKTLSEVTAIALPNGTSYQFQYDATSGLVSKIVYPSGGYVRYVWGTNPLSDYITYFDTNNTLTCHWMHDSQAITDRYVSFDGTNEILHQTFDYTHPQTQWVPDNNFPTGQKWSTKVVTVTTYDLVRVNHFRTVYGYVPESVPY